MARSSLIVRKEVHTCLSCRLRAGRHGEVSCSGLDLSSCSFVDVFFFSFLYRLNCVYLEAESGSPERRMDM